MVPIIVGNSEHAAHAGQQKNPICDCCRPNQMAETHQIKQRLLLTCAPISELPSNIITIEVDGFTKYVNSM